MIVVWLFLAVPWVCLQFVIVLFPDHTHLLFVCKYRLVAYTISSNILLNLPRKKNLNVKVSS